MLRQANLETFARATLLGIARDFQVRLEREMCSSLNTLLLCRMKNSSKNFLYQILYHFFVTTIVVAP